MVTWIGLDDRGRTREVDPVEQALRHVRSRSAGSALSPSLLVTINFHPDTIVGDRTTIEWLAQDGVYRSQFETGTSNGGLTAYPGGDRWTWESRIFGGAYDACSGSDLALRPKYGALNHRADPVGGSRRFGSCHLRLRPHVLERTTFCYPDSHMQPTDFGVAERIALVEIAIRNHRSFDLLDDYVEAHIHGRLLVADDVEAIVLDPSYRGTAIEEAAHRLACAVEWHGGFRLPTERLDDCRRYRNEATAGAIASMSEHGFVTPARLGQARAAGMDPQLAKWAWHCIARFGHG